MVFSVTDFSIKLLIIVKLLKRRKLSQVFNSIFKLWKFKMGMSSMYKPTWGTKFQISILINNNNYYKAHTITRKLSSRETLALSMGSRGPAWLCCLHIAKVCKSRGGVPGAFPSTHTLQHSTPNSLGSLWFGIILKSEWAAGSQTRELGRCMAFGRSVHTPKAERPGSLLQFPSHLKVSGISLWYESFSPCWNANTAKKSGCYFPENSTAMTKNRNASIWPRLSWRQTPVGMWGRNNQKLLQNFDCLSSTARQLYPSWVSSSGLQQYLWNVTFEKVRKLSCTRLKVATHTHKLAPWSMSMATSKRMLSGQQCLRRPCCLSSPTQSHTLNGQHSFLIW